MFYSYTSMKKEKGVLATRESSSMLQSRKIDSVKCFIDAETGKRYNVIKAMIKKSYGNQSRPILIKFEQSIARKGHSNC